MSLGYVFIDEGDSYDTGEVLHWFPTHALVQFDNGRKNVPVMAQLVSLESLEGALFFKSRAELGRWVCYIHSDEAKAQIERDNSTLN